MTHVLTAVRVMLSFPTGSQVMKTVVHDLRGHLQHRDNPHIDVGGCENDSEPESSVHCSISGASMLPGGDSKTFGAEVRRMLAELLPPNHDIWIKVTG